MPNYVMNVVKFSPVIPDVEFRAFLSKVMVPAKFPDHEAFRPILKAMKQYLPWRLSRRISGAWTSTSTP